MNESEFHAACRTIMEHDSRLDSINKFLRDDDRENGEGMFTYLPETSARLRRLAIDLLSIACGLEPKGGIIEYFFDECLTMKDGGSIKHPNGTTFKLQTVDDLWLAVQYEMEQIGA